MKRIIEHAHTKEKEGRRAESYKRWRSIMDVWPPTFREIRQYLENDRVS